MKKSLLVVKKGVAAVLSAAVLFTSLPVSFAKEGAVFSTDENNHYTGAGTVDTRAFEIYPSAYGVDYKSVESFVLGVTGCGKAEVTIGYYGESGWTSGDYESLLSEDSVELKVLTPGGLKNDFIKVTVTALEGVDEATDINPSFDVTEVSFYDEEDYLGGSDLEKADFVAYPENGGTVTLEPGKNSGAVLSTLVYPEGEYTYSWSVYDYETMNLIELSEDDSALAVKDDYDYARYMCRVSNKKGESRKAFFFVYTDNGLKLSIDKGEYGRKVCTRKSLEAGTEETLTIDVDAAETESLVYLWTDGKGNELDPGEDKNTLDITADKTEVYTCEINDSYGCRATAVFNIVIENGLTAWTEEDHKTVRPGEDCELSFRYDVQDFEDIVIKWYEERDGVLEEIKGEKNVKLTLSNVRSDRNIVARVTDKYANMAEVSFRVVVDNELTVNPIAPAEVTYNSDAVLRLVVTGADVSNINIAWYNAATYDEDSEEKVILSDKAVFTVKNVREPFSYLYVVTDDYGSKVTGIVSVAIDNKLQAKAVDDVSYFSVTEGTKVRLRTEVSATNKVGVKYKWYTIGKDGELTLVNGETYSSLTIKSAQKSESYVCEVTDRYKNTVDVEFTVEIINSLSVSAKEDEVTILPGETAQLVAEVTADQMTGMTYTWEVFDSETEEWQVIDIENPGVTYRTSKLYRNTEYRFTATDKYGNESNTRFNVLMDVEPVVVFAKNDFISLKNNANVLLEAVLMHDEKSEVTLKWFKNSDDGYTEIEGATETSLRVNAGDKSSYYMIVAEDSYGYTDTVFFYLSVNDFNVEPKNGITEFYGLPGDKVTLEAVVTADDKNGVTYQWYKGKEEDKEAISKATSSKYTVTIPSGGGYYSAEVKDAYGNSQTLIYRIYDFDLADNGTKNAKKNDAHSYNVVVEEEESVTLKAKLVAEAGSADQYDIYWMRAFETNGDYSYEILDGTEGLLEFTAEYTDDVPEGSNLIYICCASLVGAGTVELGYVINPREKAEPEPEIGLNEIELYTVPGEITRLIARYSDDVDPKTLNWFTSDSKIATVDAYGNVTAQKTGNTVITIVAGNGKFEANCKIYVEFADVTKKDSKYYYKPVYWAVDKGITNGFTDEKGYASTFGPEITCSRAQMVTFLWRLAGRPAISGKTNISFKDVSKSDYYYKAVIWAAEKGITNGYKDGTFKPDEPCLREHVVTFLWRYAGKPEPTDNSLSFADVPEGKYYTKAVLWAAEKNITKGYEDGNFRPDVYCLREHIVTFMYRFSK